MNSEPKRVLIVEDDPGLALLFGEHLRRLGCSCDTVASGQACIAWLGRGVADLMVLDYSLPDMLAPALVEELRRIGRLSAFVVVTGHGDERVAVELMKLGARDYLVKDRQVFDRLPVVVQRALQDVEKERRLATTEAALLASEARLRRAEVVGGFGHWELDIEKGVIRGSEGARRIYGLEGELWPIDVPQDCVLPAYRTMLDAQFQRLIAGEAPYDAEFELRRHGDGRIVAVHSTATYDPFRRTVFGTIHDISERRQAEESLRQKTALLEAQLDSSLDGILVVDDQGKKVLQNRRTTELWKIPAAVADNPDDRAQVRHVMQMTKDPERFAAKVAHLYAHPQETSRDEVELVDGTVLDRYSAPVLGPGGRHYGRIWLFRDITEQRHAEDGRRSSYELLTKLAAQVPGVVYQYRLHADGRSCFPFLSPGMRDIFEYDPDEVREDATPVFGRLHPDDHDRIVAAIRESARTLGPFHCEFRVVLPRQGPRWRLSDAMPERMVDGGTLWYGIISDITERKRVEEALRESLHEKEALLKEVHHRVKNNLQVITSLLRLQAGQSENPGTREVLRDMQNRIRSMALLHETLYRSGNLARVDLADYLQNVCTQLLRSAASHVVGVIRLEFELEPASVAATQAVPCGLLVNELVSNCLKHAFPGGRTGEVRVSLHPVDGGPALCLRVADDGVGLPEGFAVSDLQSLGLHLVSDLSRQLDGVLAIGAGPGAQFSVVFTPKLQPPRNLA